LKAPADSDSAFLQPSRAWSKNGLFMFLGTSAKVYSAWADAAAIIAPSATAVLKTSFLISSPPVCSSLFVRSERL
jgi:hypothetical protein